jgi:CheY-like chemotaxis protein
MGAIGYALKPASREQLKQVFQEARRQAHAEGQDACCWWRTTPMQRDSGGQAHRRRRRGDHRGGLRRGGARSAGAPRVFDCMVTDLKPARHAGQRSCSRSMATEEITSFPPVIVYTGRNLTRDEEAELLRYSRSIIIKGARSPERLLDEVTLFLHKVEADLSTERRNMLKAARRRDRVFEGRKHPAGGRRRAQHLCAHQRTGAARRPSWRSAATACEAHRASSTEVADIDLVLMDVMMPEHGRPGSHAAPPAGTRASRNCPSSRSRPRPRGTTRNSAWPAGASDYLAKPIDLDRLFSLLRVWMPNLERL